MALFGVPYESRSHATDAVLAALNLQRELRDHFPLNMRVGINSGTITAGMLGPKNKSLYDVLGDPVNIASRMEAICPAGGITLSRETYNLVKPYFDITAMGEREVKGLRLVECFQATDVVSLAADTRRVDPTSRFAALAPPLVARVDAIKTEQLGAVDFLSIQARDGALGHNEAVAVYALGLLGALKDGLGGFTVDGIEAVDADNLVALALAHDIGKFAIEPARLNDPALSGPAIDSLRDDLAAKTTEALATLELQALAPSVEAWSPSNARAARVQKSISPAKSLPPPTSMTRWPRPSFTRAHRGALPASWKKCSACPIAREPRAPCSKPSPS